MEVDKSNLLAGLREPEKYYCTAWMYTAHHSELAIRITSDHDELPTTQSFFLLFSGVLFYEGPLRWHNADFSVDNSERDIILAKIYPSLNNPEKIELQGLYQLVNFIDKMTGLEVKILFSGVNRVEKLPE